MAKKRRVNYISWIYRKIRRRIPLLLFQCILVMAISYANIQFSLTTKAVVNSALAGDLPGLKTAAIIMICLSLFRLFGNSFSQFLNVNLHEVLERDFKKSVLHTIFRSDYSRISKHHSGDLIQRLDSDAMVILQGVGLFTSGLAGMITSLVAAAVALMSIAPQFTIICGGIALVLASTALLFRNVLKKLSKDASFANGKVKGFLHENISKLMVIQALDVAAEVESRSDKVLDERWEVRKKQRNISLFARFGTSSVGYLSYLATMLWCGWQLFSGRITVGDVTAITNLVSTIRSNIMNLPRTFPRMFAIAAACDRIMELEAIPQQPDPDAEKVRRLYPDVIGFTAEDLTFSYDRNPVMKNVSLTIPKGGLTVIVGQSGIGKSTLLKLLLGLYDPDSGRLVLDTSRGQIPVDRSTRSLFSYAPQGNFLLSGTLRENLTFTNPQATEEEIQHALYVSAMDEYIKTLPDGLETVLLENGAGLSEGQAQRLSLARAIISGAPVLLLDEVTSALDAATEQTVLERICSLPGKTCIAVTHRPAALALASQIIEVTEAGMTVTER